MKSLFIFISFFIVSLNTLASPKNCLSLKDSMRVCPNSSWSLRKRVTNLNYEPVSWSKKEKRQTHNFLLAKLKHQNISSLVELRNLAITQFSQRKFHWKKEPISKKNVVVAEVEGPNKKHRFIQGYLKSKDGQFYSLNCMSEQKLTNFKNCRDIIDSVSKELL